ncbi:outer membrane beta-barrel protein [Agarilytica rhodophyticola]|uniref:outer membrane beta-barrel protein n=1 Tax=Agarilytica rhodophyticola TaxID=1737490 RepID=UPI000B34659E|nr:outer membrane beta-barrel protein [Agarilytica rhodophyticola]
MKKVVVAVITLLFSAFIHAEGWYTGLTYSIADVELDFGDFREDREPGGVNIIAGHRFNQSFAIEGFVGTGVIDDKVVSDGFDFELKSVVGITAVGIFPTIADTFNIYGKLGLAKVKYDDSDGDASAASGIMFGVGAAFDITQRIVFTIEYIEYPSGEYDDFFIDVEANALNVGGYFKF